MTLEIIPSSEATEASLQALIAVNTIGFSDLDTNTDSLEALQIAANALLTTINAAVANLDGNTDNIEALIQGTNTALGTIATGSAAFQAALLTVIQPDTSFAAPQAHSSTSVVSQLPNMPASRNVTVKNNAGALAYIGASNAVTTLTGFPLDVGDTVTFPVANANQLWTIRGGGGSTDLRIMVI